MAIKDSAETWVRGKPIQAMVLVAAIGVAVGGAIGLGAGYKIEQSRTRSDVNRLQAEIKKGGVANASGPLGQRAGKVTGTSANTITLATKHLGTQQIQTSATTQFEKAVAGTTADIAVGRRLLITIGAHEVIVLPTGSKLGRLVTNVGSDSFTIAKNNGSPGAKKKMATVTRVSTISTATLADITTGSDVLAGGRAAGKGRFSATEVIVLPAHSGFAA